MVLLLGSRGQYRGRNSSGFLPTVRRIAGSALELVGFVRKNGRRGETRASRASSVSGWLALGAALACFGTGYLVGNATAGPKAPAEAGLNAKGGPQQPAIIGEFDAQVLANQAFIVSVYPNLDATEAKARAKALSDWLRSKQLEKARPHEYQTDKGPLWVVAVYFDGTDQEGKTRSLLQGLPEDVPDPMFVRLRKTEEGWPTTYPIR